MACALQETEEGTEMQRGTGAKAAGIAKAIGKTPLIAGSSALSRASPFSGPQIAHKVTKTQLFCKACSFSPEFACSEAHGFCPAKAFFPGGSQPCQRLGSSPSRKPLTALVGERNNHLSQKTKQTPTNKQTNIKNPPNNQESPQMNSCFFA